MANEALLLAQQPEDRIQDQEIMLHLDDTQRDRFVKFQELFETEGWALLKELFQYEATQAGIAGANATSWEDNREQFGRRDAWDKAAEYETSIMNGFEAVAQDAIDYKKQLEVEDDLTAE